MPYSNVFAVSPSVQPGGRSGLPPTGTAGLTPAGQTGTEGLKRWTITPSVQLGQVYVNSGGTIPSGQSGDYYVSEVNPGLSVSGRSPRASLNLNYRMQNIFYARHSSADNTYHQLNAAGTTTLVNNLLYFDASSRMSQQIISPTQQIYLGNFSLSGSGNRTDVRTYALSPYMHYSFGTTASTTVRYSRQWLTYSKRPQYDNNSNIYSVSLRSGPSFGRLNWGVSSYREDVMYAAYSNVSLESLQGQLGWLVAPTLNVYVTGGYDQNHYASLSRTTSGKSWSVGFTWSPGIRTSLSGSYGRRYFGATYSLKLRHRARHITWSANYSVYPSTIRGFQNSSAVIGLINPSGQVTLVNFLIPTVSQQVFITKRGSMSVTRKFNQGSMNISVYGTRRVYQQTGEHTDYYGTHASLSRKLGRRSSASLKGAWVRYNYQTRNGYDYWYAGIDFTHQLSRTIKGSLRYLYSTHAASGTSGNYSENIVAAYIHVKL